MDKIVVTRHQSLVKYLIEIGLIDNKTKIITHAHPEDVEDMHVIGVLPYWLSSKAGKYTEIQLRLPPDKRNKDLTIAEVKFFANDPKTYVVRECTFGDQ